LKFKESAGDGGGYLLNTYAEYLMSERFTSPSYQTYGPLGILPRLKDAAAARVCWRPLKYVRAIHNKYNGQSVYLYINSGPRRACGTVYGSGGNDFAESRKPRL